MRIWLKRLLPFLSLTLAFLLLSACETMPEQTEVPTESTIMTEPPTQPTTLPTDPPTEPPTEPPIIFTQREYTTVLEGVFVDTWTLEDDTVYIRLADFLSAAGVDRETLPETEVIAGSDGYEYIPMYATVESLGYPVLEDTQFSATYITPSAAPFEIPANVQVPVLMYHAVSDDLWGIAELFVSPDDMEAQLKYLVDNGYDPIWFSDLKNIEEYDKPVILTFDDGYDDNYDILLPLLEKYQVKVTVFVIAGDVGLNHKMTWDEVKTMSRSGLVSVQSHGMTHGNMKTMTEDELIYDLGDSRVSITRMSEKIPYVLCYPSGKYSDLTLEVAERYYNFGLKMNGLMYSTWDNPYLVNRYYISRYTSLNTFASYIQNAGEPAN